MLLLLACFTLILFFPGIFTKYLQVYANRKYLAPLGLHVSYNGFAGNLWGTIEFQGITVAAEDAVFHLKATNVKMNIDFLRLLRRDLSFDQLSIEYLQLQIPSRHPSPGPDRFAMNRLPWVSIRDFRIDEGTVNLGDDQVWLRVSGNLDVRNVVRWEDFHIEMVHLGLSDTLVLDSESLVFDGEQLSIIAGNLIFGANRLGVDGTVQLFPVVDVDLQVKSDQLDYLDGLPEWLELQTAEGSIVGPPDGLEFRLAMGMLIGGRLLDEAQVSFSLTDEGIRIDRSLFARGTQRIQARGEVDFGGNLALELSFFHARLDEFIPTAPALTLDGSTTIQLAWQDDELDSLHLVMKLDRLEYEGKTLRHIRGTVQMSDQLWRITDTTSMQIAGSRLQLWGSVNAAQAELDLEVYLQTDSLAALLSALGLAPVEGRANGQVWVSGPWNDPALTGTVMLGDAHYHDVRVGKGFIQFVLDRTVNHLEGRLNASLGDLDFMGIPAEGGEAEFIFAGDTIYAASIQLYQGLERLFARGHLTLSEDGYAVLDTLSVSRNMELLTTGTIVARHVGNRWELSPATIAFADAQLSLSGEWTDPRNFALQAASRQLDMERLYRFLGEPSRLRGVVDADITVSNQANHLSITGKLVATDGEVYQIPFSRLRAEVLLEENHLTIQALNWRNGGAGVKGEGVLIYQWDETRLGGLGALDSLAFSGELDAFPLHDLQPILPWSLATYGAVTGSFEARGPAHDPVYTADFRIAAPQFDLIKGEHVTGHMRYEAQRLTFTDLALKTPKGAYTGGGVLPVDLRLAGDGGIRLLPDQPVDLAFAGTTTQMDFITPYFDVIDSLNGTYNIELALSGTFDRLMRNGTFEVKNGRVELFVMENPIVNLEGRAVITDNILRIERLIGQTPKEPPKGILDRIRAGIAGRFPGGQRPQESSELVVSGTMDLSEFFHPAFDLQLTGEHVYFATPLREIEAVGSPSLTVVGKDTIQIRGDFVPDPGELVLNREFTSSESYALKKPNQGTILVYNIHVPFYSGAAIRNSELDVEVEGEITLTAVGSEDFRYAGTVDVTDGNFIYNGYDFTLIEGRVILEPSTFNPQFYIQATTEIDGPRSGSTNAQLETVEVTLLLTGTLEEPSLSFRSSSLSYTESALLQLFALGQEPRGNGLDPGYSAQWGLENIILRELEKDTRLVAGLDQFQIQSSGLLASADNNRDIRFRLGKRLSPRWYVGMQADPTMNFSQYRVAYRLNRNMTLEGSVDPNGLYQVNYRIKYRY
ncbi:MAG: translocation/assembly module TamB domain-containing protein [Candidatus Marinimicrobia bacterium]|nr:translocation/assembly module TamB domain-containing protein [Candidatus Neomarinimicrobiota bacterium]